MILLLPLISYSLDHTSTLPSLFFCPTFQTSPCVFSDCVLLFIQSNETSGPDGRWIIISFIFKSTAFTSQWPNQFKCFAKLRPAHTPTRLTTTRQTGTFSHSVLQTCWRHWLVHTLMTTYFCGLTCRSLSGLQKPYMSCRPFPSAAQPVCEQPNNGACVWQRWMGAQGNS